MLMNDLRHMDWSGRVVDVMVASIVTQISSALIPITGSRLSLTLCGICLLVPVGMV